MYIYNITFHVVEKIHLQWLIWMREKHIRDVLATGKFDKALLTQVITEGHQGGLSYSVQFTADNKDAVDLYFREDANRLTDEAAVLFGDEVLAFGTELKVIESFETQENK